jgi:hypothetical protein
MAIYLGIVSKGTIKIKFSNGFGNNLFQYCFGRLLAEYHNLNYSHPAIPELGIKEEKYKFNKNFKTIKFKAKNNLDAKKYDKDHLKWFSKEYGNCNFDFHTFMFYFEDHKIYKSYLERIKLFFPKVKKRNNKDLVLHFRLENRVVQETHYKNIVRPEIYREIISNNFDFDKLYIVTDSDRWGYVNERYIKKLHKKYSRNLTAFVSIKKSIAYMNRLVDVFKDLDPVIVHNDNMIEDFNFIRSFDKIMFKNSTFAWWAAVLSGASMVGVFGPWKPNKKNRNKNLGKANFPGWFSWGSERDLLKGIK